MDVDALFASRLQSQIGSMVFQLLRNQIEIEHLTALLAEKQAPAKTAKTE